jgi:hypothetical protein
LDMSSELRTAEPGDVCVLLGPGQDEAERLHRLQASLQSVFGGVPHEPVHLTCQRFEMAQDVPLPGIIQHLEARLAVIPPISVVADSVIQIEHPFWQSTLLRWHIDATDEVSHLSAAIEDGLVAAGTTPHFPRDSGWAPALVTALEGITPLADLDRQLNKTLSPLYLFTGRWVVLSRILGQGEFELLWAMQLTGQIERSSSLCCATSCADRNRGKEKYGSSDSTSTVG